MLSESGFTKPPWSLGVYLSRSLLFFFYQYYATRWTLYRFCTLWLQRSFVLWQQDGHNKCPTNSISFWSNQIFFFSLSYTVYLHGYLFSWGETRTDWSPFKVNIRGRQTIKHLRHGKIFVFHKLSLLLWNFGVYFLPLKLCTTKYCKKNKQKNKKRCSHSPCGCCLHT